MADRFAWPEEARERGNRIIAALCGISRRRGGKPWCLTPEQCARYPKEHANGE